MDWGWVPPVLIVAGVAGAAVAYWRQARRDARKRADQAAPEQFRAGHLHKIRSGS